MFEIQFVSKGWGFEKIFTNTELYCLKMLYLAKDRKCSVHYHRKKDETFVVFSGIVFLEYHLPELWTSKLSVSRLNDAELLEEARNAVINSNGDVQIAGCIKLNPGDKFHVPPLTIHRFTGIEDAQIIEASTQDFKEDSYRALKGD
jgi:D-lyxose ketol-isomerase